MEKHEKTNSLESRDSPELLEIEVKEAAGLPDDFVPATPEEEAAVIRKLDWRLLPFVFLLYMLAVLDRSNLGNARLAGLEDAIDLEGWNYNWLGTPSLPTMHGKWLTCSAGTIFYIAYICSQWMLTGWKIFPPHIFCACAVLFWGFIATIQATVFNWAGLMVCRFFLGVAEAMFGPGVPLYLSFFYPREKIGFRHGVFIAGAAMANAYGGALAYALSHIHNSVAPWKLLFIIEGLPTCLLAVVTWWWLPDNIGTTRFLNARQKQIASVCVARNQQADPHGSGFKIKECLAAFKEPKSLLPAFMYFGYNVSFASLPLFVPTIISQLGFTGVISNGLSSPPYLLCFFTILGITWLSDRVGMRGPFIVLCSWTAAVGFLLQANLSGTTARYIGVFLTIQIFVCVPLTLAWVANIHQTESKRAGGNVILATIGQFGPLLGTNVFPNSDKPFFRKGMWISAAMCIFVGCLAIILSCILIAENKSMERKGLIPKKGEEGREPVQHGVAGEEAKVPRYRYIW